MKLICDKNLSGFKLNLQEMQVLSGFLGSLCFKLAKLHFVNFFVCKLKCYIN